MGFFLVFEEDSRSFIGEAGLFHLLFDDTQTEIEINYHYQAKKDIFAHAMISADTKAKMLEQLNTDNKLFHEIVTNIHDTDNAQIATVKSTWQIKSWDTVRTKV